MTAQPLHLFALPPATRLTARQQTALDAITKAGYDGLHTDEVGAAVHAAQGKHSPDDICEWCPSTGQQLGKRLRELGHVQQRRRKAAGGDVVTVWTVAGKLTPVRDSGFIPF